MRRLAAIIASLFGLAAAAIGDLADFSAPPPDHPAIEYFNYAKHPPADAVAALNRRLSTGQAQLRFEAGTGYLRSVLEALQVPVDSQVVVFSRTSLQAPRIEPRNPRTIFFNDRVAVAWVSGGFMEAAAQDPEQGVIFYSLEQQSSRQPEFQRRDDCLRCHISDISLGVPGMMVRSRYTATDGRPLLIYGGFATDHRSPLSERWGGWYVTGHAGSAHLGNAMLGDADGPEDLTGRTPELQSLTLEFDTTRYLSAHSDVVALLVFNHQLHMMNLLTRVGWDARAALYKHRDVSSQIREGVREMVDYLLFIDEAQLTGKIRGTSGFAESFPARGPRDSKGRSLREFDLERRMFRYPCSYMIYSETFDALPAEVRAEVYRRMWQILSGEEKGERYARLSAPDRRAIVEILRDTKKGLPEYFR